MRSDGWESVKASVHSREAIDFRGWETDNAEFEQQFELVVKALRSNEDAQEKPPTQRLQRPKRSECSAGVLIPYLCFLPVDC